MGMELVTRLLKEEQIENVLEWCDETNI
jgi:hypothetical protein